MDRLHRAISGDSRQLFVTELIYYRQSKEAITRKKYCWKLEAVVVRST